MAKNKKKDELKTRLFFIFLYFALKLINTNFSEVQNDN